MLRPLTLAALCVAVVGCRQRLAPKRAPAFLGADVARVGDVGVPPLLVARVAVAEDAAPRQALDGLVEDALVAEAARVRKLESQPAVEWATNVALARALSRQVQDEARAKGPPNADELARLRVIHAVILRSPSLPRARALALADSLRQVVSVARDENEFEQRAKTAVSIPVTVERLPQFDATGQMEHGGELDPVFVSAAFRLHLPGETSPVVETQFGWHVLRLMTRAAPDPGSAAGQADAFMEAVVELRARTAIDETLRARKQRLSIDVSLTADELMAETLPVVR